MPTNVTPEYKKAKEQFRRAREPAERLTWLKEMLRTVPKHKGTDHLQAEIKSRIKQTTEEIAGPKKGAAKAGPVYVIHPEGAAQVALVGPPNAGKSTLHRLLTGSHAECGPYPFTTHSPLPGMLGFEDIHFQLVDLPPVSATYMESWMPNALQPARAVLLVIDLSSPGCVENVAAIKKRLDEKRISLTARWPCTIDAASLDLSPAKAAVVEDANRAAAEDTFELDDPFRTFVPTLLVANKSDVAWNRDELGALEELIGVRFPAVAVSAATGAGVERLGRALFTGLGVVRVYTKVPGKPADSDRPFTVFEGDSIQEVAELVHRELAHTLKYARVWGSAKFDGQRVGKEHLVRDGDIVELHS